ncbi:MAG: cyclodeaminase/cyclohydrolase family protein [Candidatus Muiribacteriaceae bacterium]
MTDYQDIKLGDYVEHLCTEGAEPSGGSAIAVTVSLALSLIAKSVPQCSEVRKDIISVLRFAEQDDKLMKIMFSGLNETHEPSFSDSMLSDMVKVPLSISQVCVRHLKQIPDYLGRSGKHLCVELQCASDMLTACGKGCIRLIDMNLNMMSENIERDIMSAVENIKVFFGEIK